MNKKAAFIAAMVLLIVTLIPVKQPDSSASEPPQTVNENAEPSENTENQTVFTYVNAFSSESSITPEEKTVLWKENSAVGKMYVSADGVYSRIYAIEGSKKVSRYSLDQEVVVTAVTDTGYYRLDSGDYIHEDYLKKTLI